MIKNVLRKIIPSKIKELRRNAILGQNFANNNYIIEASRLRSVEVSKQPYRFDIINYLIQKFDRKTTYLEIGVRNPSHNYDRIVSDKKYSVDPGVEFESNPVDFPLTSDDFFAKLRSGDVLNPSTKFDVIFIDGLHLADQVDKDISNSLDFLKEDGFLVLHDCNPPTEWHARETYNFYLSPAEGHWNGTTWKAFTKWRQNPNISGCCINSDWGVGIFSKTVNFGENNLIDNPYFEYHIFEKNRKKILNLIEFNDLKSLIGH